MGASNLAKLVQIVSYTTLTFIHECERKELLYETNFTMGLPLPGPTLCIPQFLIGTCRSNCDAHIRYDSTDLYNPVVG